MNQINTIAIRDLMLSIKKMTQGGIRGTSEYDRLEENIQEIDMMCTKPPKAFESPFKFERKKLVS